MIVLQAEALKNNYKEILDNKSKFLPVHSSSGFKHALKEVLADPTVALRLENTKSMSEVKSLDAFFEMLNSDPDRAYYGFAHVQKANELKAIDTLLVSDELFRSADIQTRARYVQLVESVRENGGDVKIFSTLHVSGEQLTQLSGVAAILRFPLPEDELGDAQLYQIEEPKTPMKMLRTDSEQSSNTATPYASAPATPAASSSAVRATTSNSNPGNDFGDGT